MRTMVINTFKVEGSRGEFYVSTSGMSCVPSGYNNTPIRYPHSLWTIIYDCYYSLAFNTNLEIQPIPIGTPY